MTRTQFTLIITLIATLCSCTHHRIQREMDRIEPLIMSDPTAARGQLDSLYAAEPRITDDEALQARYFLLRAYTNYRDYIITEEDSTLLLAEPYYETHGTDYERMLVKMLLATWYSCCKDMCNTAISLYKEALEEDVKGEQHLLRGQVNTYLYYQHMAKNDSICIKYAETALEDYKRYGDPEFIIEGQINLGYGLSHLGQNSAAIEMLKEALAGAEKERISFSCSKIHKYLGETYANWQNDSARYYYESARQKYNYQFDNRDYDILAWTYSLDGNKAKAMAYLDSAMLYMSTIHTPDNVYTHYLFAQDVYENLMEKDSADYYGELAQQTKNSIHDKETKELNEQVDSLKAANKMQKEESEEANKTWLLCLCVIGVTAATGSFLVLQKRRNVKNGDLQQSGTTDPRECILRMKESDCAHHLRELIENDRIIDEKSKKELNNLFEKNYPSFTRGLRNRINLTSERTTIFQLEKLGFANNQIADLMAKTPNAICNTNKRACEEYLEGEGSSTKWREIIGSL